MLTLHLSSLFNGYLSEKYIRLECLEKIINKVKCFCSSHWTAQKWLSFSLALYQSHQFRYRISVSNRISNYCNILHYLVFCYILFFAHSHARQVIGVVCCLFESSCSVSGVPTVWCLARFYVTTEGPVAPPWLSLVLNTWNNSPRIGGA